MGFPMEAEVLALAGLKKYHQHIKPIIPRYSCFI